MGTLNLWRLSLSRIRRLWALQLALWIGLVAAFGFAGATALIQATAAGFELQSFLTGLGANNEVLVSEWDKNDPSLLPTPNPALGYRAFQGVVADRAKNVSGGLLTVRGTWASSSQHYFATINGEPYSHTDAPSAVFAAYEGIDTHVAVVASEQPPTGDAAVPIALTETSASAIGAKLGDLLCLGDLQPKLCVRVVSLWRPSNSNDPFLSHQFVVDGDMFLSIDRFYKTLSAYPKETITAYARLDVDLTVAQRYTPAAALDRLNAFGVELSVISHSIAEQDELVGHLHTFVEQSSAAQFTTQLIPIQVLGMALLYVAFACGHVLNQQRESFAVWRVRGWSSTRAFAALMIESALMTLIAMPAGLLIAFTLANLVSRAEYNAFLPDLRLTDLILSVGIALVAILAVLIVQILRASRLELLDVRRQLSRPGPRPWWQWRYLDLGLGLLSIPILLQLRIVAGSNPPASDPLSISLPILVLVLLGVAALRLLPPLARVSASVGRGLATSMAASQFARQPAHAGAALMLVVSSALGVFIAIFAATEVSNSADRAAYRVGSDILISSTVQRPNFTELAPQLHGLRFQSLAYRSPADLGTTGGPTLDLLALEPYSMKNAAWSRSGLNSTALPELLHQLVVKDQGGILINGHPNTLTLWVYTAGGRGLNLIASITDSNGQPCDCPFGALGGSSWTHVSAPIRFTQPAAYPLRFRGLKLLGEARGDGIVAISDLRADGAELESFGTTTGWGETDPLSHNSSLLSSELVPRDGLSTVEFSLAPASGQYILSPSAHDDPIPALTSSATMAALNLVENAPYIAYINGYPFQFTIVGVADNFPTLYQSQGPWLVAALVPLVVELSQASPNAVWPNQAWYAVDPAADAYDLAVAQRSFPEANILDRRQLAAAALSNPVWLGVESNLLIGAIAAFALGIAAFALHFLVVTQGRLKEYAILEATGLPRALIWRSLLFEQLIVLGFALATAVVLGLLLAFVLLPSLQFGNGQFDGVPSTVVTIDFPLVVAVLGSVALIALLIGRIGARIGSRYRLMDELRSLG
jgi:hypothetical protein